MLASSAQPSPTDVAYALGRAFDERGQDYAFGGALALGYWTQPRSTIDVDVTLYLPPDRPGQCVALLQDVGCEVSASDATAMLNEHGFCRVRYASLRVDVFLPTIPFYEIAKARRKCVPLKDGLITIWDPETLAVFKMMFFREKDMLDLKQILRSQMPTLDRIWVRNQLVEIYGSRDVRILRWDELASESST